MRSRQGTDRRLPEGSRPMTSLWQRRHLDRRAQWWRGGRWRRGDGSSLRGFLGSYDALVALCSNEVLGRDTAPPLLDISRKTTVSCEKRQNDSSISGTGDVDIVATESTYR